MEDKLKLANACMSDDGKAVAKIMAESSDPRQLYDSCPAAHVESLLQKDSSRALNAILTVLPELVKEKLYSGSVPLFLHAAHNYHTACMLVLAKHGADMNARYENPNYYVQYNPLQLACLKQRHTLKPEKHLIALRTLGFDINVTNQNGETPLGEEISQSRTWENALTPRNREWKEVQHIAQSGGDIYRALKIPTPADPFNPDMVQLAITIDKLRPHDHISKFRTEAMLYVQNIIKSAPRPDAALSPELFFNNDQLRPEVHHWESCGLLQTYFSNAAAKRWKGGFAQMLEVAGHFPAYMQHAVDPVAIMRNTATAREDSVTISYMRGQATERSFA